MSWKSYQKRLIDMGVQSKYHNLYYQYAKEFRLQRASSREKLSIDQWVNSLQIQGIEGWKLKLAYHAAQLVIECFQPQTELKTAPLQTRAHPHRRNDYKLFEQVMHANKLKSNTIRNYLKWFSEYQEYANEVYNANTLQEFLSHLSMKRNVSPSSQNQALCALNHFFKYVLKLKVEVPRFHKSYKQLNIPEVLSKSEVKDILQQCSGDWYLFFALLYGCGLRLKEALNLRYKDIDLRSSQLFIHFSKGYKSRTVDLPQTLIPKLTEKLRYLENLYHQDLMDGSLPHEVDIPYALKSKFPKWSSSLDWQYFFVNPRLMRHPDSGKLKRFHYHPDTVRRQLSKLRKELNFTKRLYPHIFRHSFATHCLENGILIEQLKDILGHSDIKTTMTYLHTSSIHKKTESPLDGLDV